MTSQIDKWAWQWRSAISFQIRFRMLLNHRYVWRTTKLAYHSSVYTCSY